MGSETRWEAAKSWAENGRLEDEAIARMLSPEQTPIKRTRRKRRPRGKTKRTRMTGISLSHFTSHVIILQRERGECFSELFA